jgi:hypothetical protein
MKALLSILLLLAPVSAFAAELSPLRQENQLGARIYGSSFPESFAHDLTSGLTNRLIVRFTLHQAARELSRRSVEIAIRYDLWDETFTVTTSMDGVSVESAVCREAEQVIRRLQEIRLPELFSTSGVPPDSELVIRAVMLLNPLDRERMDTIRKWVAQNSRRSSLDPAGALSARDISLSNAILERIFEQYASGGDVVAGWQQALATQPFDLIGLPREPH